MYDAITLPSALALARFALHGCWELEYARATSTLARTVTSALLVCALQLVSSPNVASQNRDPFGKGTYEATITLAGQLAEVQPTTMWESPVDGEAADLVEYISDDRLVVGVVEVAGNGTPRHGPLYMLDANDGSLLWEYERDRIGTGSYSLLPSAPFLLLVGIDEGSVRYTALDPDSGDREWDVRVDTPYGVAFSPERQAMLLLYRDGSTWKLRAIDLRSGDRRWQREIESDVLDETTPGSVTILGDAAFVIGRSILEVSVLDGEVVRSLPAPPLSGDAGKTLSVPDGFVAWDSSSLTLVDHSSGQPRWVAPTEGGSIQSVVVADAKIVRVRVAEESRSTSIDLVDPEDGTVLWTYDVGGSIVSPVAEEGGLLLFTTESTLVGIGLDDGSTAFSHALRDEMAAGSPTDAETMGMPDVIRSTPGTILVARERAGLAAFDLPSGTERWYQAHYESPNPLLNYTADGRYSHVLATLMVTGRGPADGEVGQLNFGDGTGTMVSPLLSVAQRDYEAARTRYEALGPDASTSERGGAVQLLRLTSELQLSAAQLDVTMSRFNAGMELATSVLSLAGTLKQIMEASAERGQVDRTQFAMQSILRLQHRLFQNGYYVRPFYLEARGRGVTMVEGGSGLRRDIIFSPHSPPSIAFGVDLPTFAVSPSGNRFASVGISLDADRYTRRDKWDTYVPNFSILSYDLETIEFGEGATLVMLVADAVFANDSAMVALLLDQGGDVNERYVTENETPLHFAVGFGHVGIVRLLLERGADVNALTDSGKTPLDFNAYRNIYDLLVAAGGTSASGELPPRPAEGPHPLVMAVARDEPAVVRALIEGGADVNLALNQGETLLFLAAALDRPDLVRLLLELGADVNVVSENGQTALDLAPSEGMREILRAAGGRPGGGDAD